MSGVEGAFNIVGRWREIHGFRQREFGGNFVGKSTLRP